MFGKLSTRTPRRFALIRLQTRALGPSAPCPHHTLFFFPRMAGLMTSALRALAIFRVSKLSEGSGHAEQELRGPNGAQQLTRKARTHYTPTRARTPSRTSERTYCLQTAPASISDAQTCALSPIHSSGSIAKLLATRGLSRFLNSAFRYFTSSCNCCRNDFSRCSSDTTASWRACSSSTNSESSCNLP